MTAVGPIGRLGRWTAGHVRLVVIAWAVVAVGLGALAPKAEHALSGAGWEATGSESVAARDAIDASFAGQGGYALTVAVHGPGTLDATVAEATRLLASDPRVSSVGPPQVSQDGRTVLLSGGAAASPTEMVRAADDLKGKLADLSHGSTTVSLTGAPGMWSDFNQANKSAMMKSEVLSWPVTLAILLLAFGSLVAAGLPLLLTILGLMASAGSLFLITHLFDVSIWSMNFALMFALALGIDYALFIVARFRGAHFGSQVTTSDAVAVTMDTAGKAVLFSGVTVLISLSAVMLVPSPAFRSMALGIMLSVAFILLATLTLLPAVLAWLGSRVDRLALPWVHAGEHRSPRFARWGERLWRHPALFGIPAAAILVLLALPVLRLDTGMPSIKVVPQDRWLEGRLHADPGGVRAWRARDAAGRLPGGRRGPRPGGARGRPGDRRASRRHSARAITHSSSPSPPPTRRIRRSEPPSTGSAPRCPRACSSGAPPRRTTISRRRSRRRRFPSSSSSSASASCSSSSPCRHR